MAKGWTVRSAARVTMITMNGVFLLLGVVIVILSAIAVSKLMTLSSETSLLHSLSLPTLVLVILITAVLTVLTAAVGIFAATFVNGQLLRLYVVVVFIIVSLQIGIGAYIMTLNTNALRTDWMDETSSGFAVRTTFQSAMSCCGYETFTDSIGFLQTPCPYLPAHVGGAVPVSCHSAVRTFVSKWIAPVAAAAISAAAIELTAVAITLAVMYQRKQQQAKSGFEY